MTSLTCIKNKLKERFISYWEKCLISDTGMDKLRTYKLIKRKFELEKYLEVLPDRKQRKALTAFRISSHKLQIERGRYSGKKIEERLCATCNVIEDEIHLFCDCVKYMSLRNNMYQYIFNSNVIRFNSQKELFIQ